MRIQPHGTDQDWTLLYYEELAAPERAALQDHLQDCAACRRDYDALCHTLDALPRQQAPELDSAARERFVARVTRSRRTPLWRQPAVGGLLSTALAAVVAVVLWPSAPLPHRPAAPQLADSMVERAPEESPRMVVSKAAASLNTTEIEIVEQMDLLQNLDILSQWELVQETES